MKKYIVFLVAALFSLTASTQNWKPINKSEKFNYSLGGANNFYATIWVDSTKLEHNDSVYFFNKIIKKVRNGAMPYTYGYYLLNQSQFLLAKMIYYSNHDVVFEESKNKRYKIKPLAKINDSWLFDSINNVTAQISKVYSEKIFGYLDSIKVITLSNKDSIILSKNSGLLKFPIVDPLKHVNLVGIEGRYVGTIFPQYIDFFDFNVGDVFYYQSSSSTRWTGPKIWEKFTILSKEIKDNTFKYKANYQSKTNHYSYNTFTYSDYKNVPDTILTYNAQKSFLNHYPNEILNDSKVGYKYKPIVAGFNETFKTITKSFIEHPFCSSTTDTIIEHNLSPIACVRENYTEIYGKNVGLISRSYHMADYNPWGVSRYTDLVGCIRNGQAYGTILNESIFSATNVEDEIVSGKGVKIYPNPSKDWINIEISSAITNPVIYISDLSGKVLLTRKLDHTFTKVYIGSLRSGAYFVKYKSEKGVKVEKLLIE